MSSETELLSDDDLLDLDKLMGEGNVEVLVDDETTHTLKTNSDDFPYTLSLRIAHDETDEKEIKKFVKQCESIIRSSPEYKLWIDYIKEVSGLLRCSVTGEMVTQVKVEVHHHPICLYNITQAVVMDYIEKQKEFCSFDVCTKVIELHFENKVGYVPLVQTVHQKFHNGYLLLPMELVKGNYKEFLEKYMNSLPEDDVETIQRRLIVNRDNCGWKTYWGHDPQQTEN